MRSRGSPWKGRHPSPPVWRAGAQLVFVDLDDEAVGLDLTLLDGQDGIPRGTPFHVSGVVPQTAAIAVVVQRALEQWADDGRELTVTARPESRRLDLSDGTSKVLLDLGAGP